MCKQLHTKNLEALTLFLCNFFNEFLNSLLNEHRYLLIWDRKSRKIG